MNYLKTHRKQLMKLAAMFLFILAGCLIFYRPLVKLVSEPEILKEQLAQFGFGGVLIVIGIMTLQIIFPFLPGEIVEVAAGFLYGPIYGTFVCLVGALLGSIIIYGFVNYFGVKLVRQLFSEEKIQKLDHLSQTKHLYRLLFWVFFIPGTPKDLLTYMMPVLQVPLLPYLGITTLARFPSVVTSTVSGNAFVERDYLFMAIVFGTTALISLFGLWIYQRYVQKQTLGNL